jgi:dTDP-4-amino-4,6-dideoxygalactose transaminase
MTGNTNRSHVPLADPVGDTASERADILAAVASVLDHGPYILGPSVTTFEREMAARLGVAATVGVGSGTDALVLALLAVGVEAEDEVITVSHTAGPTVAAINMIGANPVLIDVEAATCCLDPQKLEDALGTRTKAIIAVHLYGHPADMKVIAEFGRRHGIAIVEDCAQAQGATIGDHQVGSIGEVGCFSFYPTKNLGAIGDAGLVTARDRATAERLGQLRTYGWTEPQYATLPNGRCSRLDELQAAILLVKLKHLNAQIERRRAIALRYRDALQDLALTLPSELGGCRHVYHLYVVRTDDRDRLKAHLRKSGVCTGLHYPYPVHVQSGLMKRARVAGPLSVTEALYRQILTLPLYPSMTESQQIRVIEGVRSFFGNR